MRYLRNNDYKYKINQYDLDTLLQDEINPEMLILDAELKAQEVISLFLRKRYDLPQLFRLFDSYQSGFTYTTGSTPVWYSTSGNSYNEYLYSPISATTTSPTSYYWIMVEPRFSLIIGWMTTISLYKLHQRVSPDNIPTHRQNSYDEVMKLLKMVQEEKISPDFPGLENRSYGIYITGRKSNGINFLY